MTDEQKCLDELRSATGDLATVVSWLVEQQSSEMPRYVTNALGGIETALAELRKLRTGARR